MAGDPSGLVIKLHNSCPAPMLKTSRLRISPPQGRKPSSNEHFSTHKPRAASQLRFPHPAKVRHSCMVAVVSSAETGQSRTHARIIIKCSGHPFKPPQRPHSRRKRCRCRLSTFVGVAKSASEPRSVVWEFPQPVGEGGPVLDQQEEEEDTAQKVFSKNSVGFYFCSLSLPINLHLAWRHQERGPRERRGNATRLRLLTVCFNCCLLCYTCEMLTNSLSLVRF